MEISSAGAASNESTPYVETDPSGRYGRVSCSVFSRFAG